MTPPGGLAKRDVVALCVLLVAATSLLAIPEDTRGMSVSVHARVYCVRVCMRAFAVMMHFYIIDHSSSDSGDVSHTMGDNIKILDLPGCAVCVRAHVCCVCFKTKNFQAKHARQNRAKVWESAIALI